LFRPVGQTGEIRISRLRGESIAYILMRRREQAGVDHLSPHDLRRSFVTALLDAGEDVFTVQKLAGHADANPTAQYDRRDEGAKRRAVEQIRIPMQAAWRSRKGCGAEEVFVSKQWSDVGAEYAFED